MAFVKANMHFGYLLLFCQVGFVFMGAPLPKFNAQRCDALKLDDCFKNLQVFLRLKSLPYTSDTAELNKLCEQSVAGYNCSRVLYENNDCLSAQNKELLPIFKSMAEFTHLMLCDNGEGTQKAFLRPAFLEQSDCVLKHMEEIACCSDKSRVEDLPVLQILEEPRKSLSEKQMSTCCPFSLYLQCVSDVVMECGDKAVNFTSEYIRRAAGEQVQRLCQDLPNYPNLDNETCTEPIPMCSGYNTLHLQNYLYIFVFAILAIGQFKYF